MADKKDTQKSKERWPTKAVMSQIYKKSLWGGSDFDFYSGDGSHHPAIVNPYIVVVKIFLKEFHSPITVCDLGCGDFNVGHQLIKYAKKYFAIDIVDELIERNKQLYTYDNLSFKTLDICKDELPKADCVMVRQVMQHLSNVEIETLLTKLKTYKYIIVTEHLPSSEFESNINIITGQGNRLKFKSGVVLTDAPFYLKPIKEETLLTVEVDEKSRIKTVLYQNF